MRQLFVAVLCSIMIGSFFAACATAPEYQRGASTKMGKPRQAQEQVVPSQGQEAAAPQESTSPSK
ncbi:MAG: hypothetical protein JW736_02195 [Deltaproteobacteria bacterium]|nr:hypothetical protein [Deltaproteobacteria bacterium]MBN2687712.1 hypothetical protein [Deltaproteobacteria bacterium]